MYKNISNRGEVTKEKIKNAVEKGAYTFERTGNDEFSVTLTYPSRVKKVKPYSLSDLQDLRWRALLIAKPSVRIDTDVDTEEHRARAMIMDEFVRQVDIVYEICNVGTKIIQVGHFGYRQFKKEISDDNKTKELIDLLKKFKGELKEWNDIVNRAQEDHYYLTFFPARYILIFLDYFTGEENNEESCETLIKFVSNKARMPSKKEISNVSRGKKDHYLVLCEIGAKLKNIFANIPIQSIPLRTRGKLITSDLVLEGKLFVARCKNNLFIPNVIMSIYANHGNYPEPWQILICRSSTTTDELSIFLKRCFHASSNGYKNTLFCIANLELLNLELQYDLVNNIRSLREKYNNYLLALICFQEAGVHHHVLDQFSQNVVTTDGLGVETMKEIYHQLCPYAVCVTSDLSGQGKSGWIKKSSYRKQKAPRNFLINNEVNFSKLVHQLKEFDLRQMESLHINIVSINNYNDVNTFLFELLTLGFVYNEVDITCLPPRTTIFIEVASTVENQLFKLLPIASYLLRQHLSWDIENLIVSHETHSPIQVVCQYLDALDQNQIDKRDILLCGEGPVNESLPARRCQKLLSKYFLNQNADSVLSFRFVEIFVNFLADQLTRLFSSSHFRVESLKQMAGEENIRSTLVLRLLEVSKDFATRSVYVKAMQQESIKADSIDDIRIDVKSWDYSDHFLLYLASQNPDSICALYRDKNRVDENVRNFLRQFTDNKKGELEDYDCMSQEELLIKLVSLTRKKKDDIKLENYALSFDNLIKMALMLFRARANIPVVIMGEAGCGKTSLIGYLARIVEVKFRALNLHAG
ncbi:3128_t:CDS:2, partial [Acaulospora morrowiae]